MKILFLLCYFTLQCQILFALDSWRMSSNHSTLVNSTDSGFFSINNKTYFSLSSSSNTTLHTLSEDLEHVSQHTDIKKLGEFFYIDTALHFIENQSGNIISIDGSGNSTFKTQLSSNKNNFKWVQSNSSPSLFNNSDTLIILNDDLSTKEFTLSNSIEIRAAKTNDYLFSIYSQTGSSVLNSIFSSDALASPVIQNTLNEDLSDINKIHGLSINKVGELSFISSQNQQLNFWYAKSIADSFSKTLIANQKTDGSIFYINYHGAHLVVFQDNTKIKIAYSLNRGLNWTIQNSLTFTGAIIGASLNPAGKLDIWSSQGERILLENPFLISPFENISASTHFSQIILDWPEHPLVTEYDIFYNESKIDTVKYPPYLYPAGLINGDTFKVIALPNSDFKSEKNWTYTQSNINEINYFIPAVQSQTDIQLLSFPASSTVKFDKNNESVLTHLERFLGTDHNPSVWKIGTWLPASASYLEGQNIKKILNKNGYWLMSNFNMSFTVSYPVQSHVSQYLRLNPGWNMVGSFFENSISLTNATVYENSQVWNYSQINDNANPPIQPQVWHWDSGSYFASTTITLGRGYWIKNERKQDLILKLVNNNSSNLTKAYFSPKFKTETPPDPLSFTQSNTSNSQGGGGCFIGSHIYYPHLTD